MKFSIIIPVYNSTKYLEECIKSIQGQTYTNFEIILIDDGSSDESGVLCDYLSTKDPRIIVVHQENQGTSAARNTGIKRATGDYITFVDNDDFWIGNDCLEKVAIKLDRANNPDVLFHINSIFDETLGKIVPTKIGTPPSVSSQDSKSTTLEALIESNALACTVWTQVISKDLIDTNNIEFPLGKRNEDIDWTGYILESAKSITWLDTQFYAYRKGHSYAQTSKPLKIEYLRDLLSIIKKHTDIISQTNSLKDDEGLLYSYFAYPYTVLLGQIALFPRSPAVLKLEKEIFEYKYLLNSNLDPRVKKAYLVNKVFGIRTTSWILGRYLKTLYPNISAE